MAGPYPIEFIILCFYNTTTEKLRQLHVRRLAGSMTVLGLIFGVSAFRWVLLVIGAAGLNLIRSSFTDVCPGEALLTECGAGANTSRGWSLP